MRLFGKAASRSLNILKNARTQSLFHARETSEENALDWIGSRVRGKTFADIGGLWGTVNEKVTVALKAGAAEATMIDITPLDGDLWKRFHDRCSAEGISGYRCVQGNIDDPEIVRKVGTYDVVHCSGVLYHCPNPLYTMSQLAKVCNSDLILVTTVIPPTLSNVAGTVVLAPGSALFVPAMSEAQRAVVAAYWREVGAEAIGITTPCHRWSIDDYSPWWWLFTPDSVAALLKVAGFNIVETAHGWSGRTMLYLAERARTTV